MSCCKVYAFKGIYGVMNLTMKYGYKIRILFPENYSLSKTGQAIYTLHNMGTHQRAYSEHSIVYPTTSSS